MNNKKKHGYIKCIECKKIKVKPNNNTPKDNKQLPVCKICFEKTTMQIFDFVFKNRHINKAQSNDETKDVPNCETI